ncbi:amidase family protein [Rhodotorula toruloides]|uniref:Amidase family protein n=1 Tax=Rhodotorula toruloides TaxID=5286 RepID=A0A511K8U8_RHOTO|nr:amidase family protein [Rhodotorula toruloides]
MPIPLDLARLDASEALALVRKDEVSVTQYVQALISRIEERDPVVRAWAYFDPVYALEQARALDALPREKRGPLHGLPVGVKDIMLTKDMPTQYHSPIYKSKVPIGMDSAPVMILRAQGALILGKTTTTEFATCHTGGETVNPHDTSRTPGGSSSGSGAAVADFQVPVAIGTQTGGSVIRPASFNGIYGLKPTWNAISREGVKIYSLTCDTVGFFSRTIADLQLLASAFRIHDDVPPPSTPLSLNGTKFGFVKTCFWPRATEGTVQAYERAKKLLEAEGAVLEEVQLPKEFDEIPRLYHYVLSSEGRSAFLGDYLLNPTKLDPLILSHSRNDLHVTRKKHLEGDDKIAALRPVIDNIASRYDALVTPSTVDEAPVLVEPERHTGEAVFNLMWTILHVPVLNLTGFAGPAGCPLGLSLVAPRFEDERLLHLGEAVGRVFAEKGGWTSAL